MELQTSSLKKNDLKPISNFRSLLAQFLASTAMNTVLLNLNMSIVIPTIVIPPLLDATDGLQVTLEEASWFGSLLLICQPLGSLSSGPIIEPLGRKRGLLLLNLPHLVGYLLVHFATSTTQLYLASALMGLGLGLMEAPCLTYMGEISNPKSRGIMASYAGIFTPLGFCLVFLLGILTDWRSAAAICAAVPIVCLLAISQVPESPVWLIARGRTKDAEEALCWLRGWVPPEQVREELQHLIEHNAKSKKHLRLVKGTEGPSEGLIDTERVHDNTVPAQKIKNLLTRILSALRIDELSHHHTLQPLILVTFYFIFLPGCGVSATRPFMVKIFEEFSSPMDPYVATFVSSLVGIAGQTFCMYGVFRFGKKNLSIFSLLACAISNLALCLYGLCATPTPTLTWIPVTIYLGNNFFYTCGVSQIPWILISEMFPQRGRGLATGVASAFAYAISFIFTKTYINMHALFTLSGVFGFYGLVSVLGCIFVYYFLPETDNKTLEEIEVILKERFDGMKKMWTFKNGL